MERIFNLPSSRTIFNLLAIPICWVGSLAGRVVTWLKRCYGCTEEVKATNRVAQDSLASTHTTSSPSPSRITATQPTDPLLSNKTSAAAAGVFPETPKSSPLKIEWLSPLAEVPEWTRDPTHQNWSLYRNELTMIRAKIGLPDQSELTLEQVCSPMHASFLSNVNKPTEIIHLRLRDFSSTQVGDAEFFIYMNIKQLHLVVSVDEKYQGKGLGKILLVSAKCLRRDLFDALKEAIGSWAPRGDNFTTFQTKFHERTQAPFPPCASKEEFDSLPSDTQQNLLFAASQTFTGKMYLNLFGLTPRHLTITKNYFKPEEIFKVEVSFLPKYPS